MVVALGLSVACGGSTEATTAANDFPVGTWALQSYNGGPLPHTVTNSSNVTESMTGGTIRFMPSSYVIDLRISRTVGDSVYYPNYYEVGSYMTDSAGLALRPNDIPGGTGNPAFLPPPVRVTHKANTISFLQQGKVLEFVKQ